jgi:hypothetical protein
MYRKLAQYRLLLITLQVGVNCEEGRWDVYYGKE